MTTHQPSFGMKYSILLVGFIALFYILYIAQSILIPIVFSLVIAILFSPVVVFFCKLRIPNVISIALTMLLVSFISYLFIFLLSSQLFIFSESFPTLLENFYAALDQSVDWLSVQLGVKPAYLNDLIATSKNELVTWGKSSLSATLSAIGNILVMLFLIPVYVFMILYYKPLLHEFLYRLIGKTNKSKLSSILTSIKTIVQSYLVALLIEMAIMTALNTAALYIIGIEYPFILGLIGALLNVIPYIGGIVSTALPMIVALGSGNPPITAVLVLVSYVFIQFVDNNIIIPKLVGSKVKINALISIVVVLVGGALWGITGMFLSIPIIAIIKIIFDHIEPLKPWGYLIGDTMPPIIKLRFNFKKKVKAV